MPLAIYFEESMWVVISKCHFFFCKSTVPANVSFSPSPTMNTWSFLTDIKLISYLFILQHFAMVL